MSIEYKLYSPLSADFIPVDEFGLTDSDVETLEGCELICHQEAIQKAVDFRNSGGWDGSVIVEGNAQICGNAVIRMNEQTQCAPVVSGNATVMGTISGAMRVVKNAFVLPSQTVENPTDFMVYMDGKTNRLMTQDEFFNYIQNQKRNEECL